MNVDTLVKMGDEEGSGNRSEPKGGAAHVSSIVDAAPINILIVDDEPKNLTVLETVLANPKYRLVRAGSADEALLALVSEDFALLILDIRMPGMTGLELAQMIKARKKTARIPIIFLTAYYNEDEHVLEGYGTGAVDYLHKPVNATVLRSKVEVFADLHRKGLELEAANHALLAEVTERRRAENQLIEFNRTLEQRVLERNQALHASDTRLRLATEAVQLGIWSWQPDLDKLVWENNWPHDILGLAGQSVPHSTAELCTGLLHAEDRESFTRAIALAIEGRGAIFFEGRLNPPRGGMCWIEFVGQPMPLSDGSAPALFGTIRDITDRKRAEDDLREADARKDIFLATLAHELRNPLAPIRTAAHVLESTGLAAEIAEASRAIIVRQVRHMAALLDDLLDISRISRGKLELKKSVIDLGKVLDEAIESAQPLIASKRHQLAFAALPGPLPVEVDGVRLIQVMTNLLTNAAKYTSEGGRIALAIELDAAELRLSVRDNGIGIAPAMLPRVFDMFTQVAESAQERAGGLGIGLALAKGIVELHGGRLEARSTGVGQGCEFSVCLPRSCVTLEGLANARADLSASAQSSRLRHILVADDNRDAAASLALFLELKGHKVIAAHSGTDALAIALREKPEILVLDIGMPGMSGYAVAERIREESWGARAILVAMTGWGQDRDKRQAFAAGFDHHLTKPVDPLQLAALLATVRVGNGSAA
jgi:PAS domain S-box-containing protein